MKKKIMIAVTLLLVLSIVGAALYVTFVRERNVFDQMYYTRVHTSFDGWAPGNFKGRFANMEQLETIGREREDIYTYSGRFSEIYKPEYLSENAGLSINFLTSHRTIYIVYEIGADDPALRKWYCYTYSVDEKTLTYTTNDPDDETNKEFLYTIFLPDWFSVNPNTRFSINNLGSYDYVDET